MFLAFGNLHKRRDRTFRRTARFGTVSVSAPPGSRAVQCEALIRHIGWTGAMGLRAGNSNGLAFRYLSGFATKLSRQPSQQKW